MSNCSSLIYFLLSDPGYAQVKNAFCTVVSYENRLVATSDCNKVQNVVFFKAATHGCVFFFPNI